MADKEFGDLTAASLPLSGAETVALVQGGNSRRAPVSALGLRRIGTWNLASTTLATGSELDVDVTGYSQIRVQVTGASITTGGNVIMRVSANGGSSFRSTSGDYVFAYFNATAAVTPSNVTEFFIAGGAAGATNLHGIMTICGLNDAAAPITANGMAGSGVAGTGLMSNQWTTNLEAVDTVRLLTSNGSAMTAGTLTIWGQ